MSNEENLATQEVQTEVVEKETPTDTREIVAQALDKIEEQEPEAEKRVRAEDGKSKKKDEEKPEEAKAEDSPKKEPKEEQKESAPAKNPFNAWKKEAQEELVKLPEHVQAMIQEREAKFHEGIQKYKAEANFARSMQKALAPHNDYMKQLGITPEVALSNLIATERKLRTGSAEEKAAMFQQLAHDYGVDLGGVAQQPFDPKSYQMQQKIQWLESQIGNTQASQQSAVDDELGQTIAQFAQSHEYFDKVQTTMADLLEKGIAQSLDDAYAKAIRLDDAVFNEYQSKQAAESKRQEALKADQAAKAAKAAAVSVRGAPTGVTHNITPKTTVEAVEQAMRAHGLL